MAQTMQRIPRPPRVPAVVTAPPPTVRAEPADTGLAAPDYAFSCFGHGMDVAFSAVNPDSGAESIESGEMIVEAMMDIDYANGDEEYSDEEVEDVPK